MAKDMNIGLGLNLWIGWTFNSYTLHMYYSSKPHRFFKISIPHGH